MSYEVLARKWRPQSFDEVIGQDHITQTLKKAVQLGRISHAYLFSGPRGCGKTSTARILAKVINCPNLKDGNPCDACQSCLGVIQGNNLDVMEIDGASHTGVAEVKDLQESIGYAPSQHRSKVYIIDEVHMLSTNAFNALLKTLEEPPKHVYFIFATTSPHKIPDTIKSRCQRHHFKRLEIREITGQLEKICKEEKVKYEVEALRLLARKAEGSMRDGESLLDQCITASSGEVMTSAVRNILGLLDQEMVFSFLDTVSKKDPTEVLRLLDKVVDEGVDLLELSNALLEGFRDLMILSSPGDLSALLFRSGEEIEQLKGLTPAFELPDLVTIIERLCNLGFRLKTVSDPRILLESTLVDIALLDRQTDIRSLIDSLGGMGNVGGSGTNSKRGSRTTESKRSKGTETSARGEGGASLMSPDERNMFPDTGTPAAGTSTTRREESFEPEPEANVSRRIEVPGEQKRWDDFVTTVRLKKISLGVSLIAGQLVDFGDEKIVLRYRKSGSFDREQVEDPANMKFLKSMLKKHFGRQMELVMVGDEETPEGSAAAKKKVDASSPKQDNEGMKQQLIIDKILKDFDGEIVQY